MLLASFSLKCFICLSEANAGCWDAACRLLLLSIWGGDSNIPDWPHGVCSRREHHHQCRDPEQEYYRCVWIQSGYKAGQVKIRNILGVIEMLVEWWILENGECSFVCSFGLYNAKRVYGTKLISFWTKTVLITMTPAPLTGFIQCHFTLVSHLA